MPHSRRSQEDRISAYTPVLAEHINFTTPERRGWKQWLFFFFYWKFAPLICWIAVAACELAAQNYNLRSCSCSCTRVWVSRGFPNGTSPPATLRSSSPPRTHARTQTRACRNLILLQNARPRRSSVRALFFAVTVGFWGVEITGYN